MVRESIFRSLIAVSAILFATDSFAQSELVELRQRERVVLIGDTYIERMQQHGYFESMVIAANPSKDITFRNLGWSGDTVYGESRSLFGSREDGFKRLLKDVNDTKPTVIIVAYGNNEAYWGEVRVDEFEQGLSRLLDELEKTKARLVLATPHATAKVNFPDGRDHHRTLGLYALKIKKAARDRGYAVLGASTIYSHGFGPGDFRKPEPEVRISSNGIHLDAFGYWLYAESWFRRFSASVNSKQRDGPYWSVTIDAATGDAITTDAEVHSVKVTATRVSFVGAPHRLPLFSFAPNPPVFEENGMLQVTGLSDGIYHLRVDGLVTKTALACKDGIVLVGIDQYTAQLSQLRKLLREKNQLYFHRYRPQNETYLFLFRKHEQGNNAVEIAQFDPLIQDAENRIAALRKPRKHLYEIVRVE